MVKCFPQSQFYQCINFFRQNIWHSIFDQFHFHHIFGDKMTVSSDKTGNGTSRPPFGSWHAPFLGTSWMAIRERSFKYLDAQQVSQQISIFFKSKFHNERGVCQKSYFDVFFLVMIPFVIPKNFNLHRPPIHIFCLYPQDFWQISDADIFHWIFG